MYELVTGVQNIFDASDPPLSRRLRLRSGLAQEACNSAWRCATTVSASFSGTGLRWS
jgi:hypothetical protein